MTSGSAFGTGLPTSNKFLLYQGANAAVTPTVVNGTIGPIQDAVINSGYLYLAGDRLATINLSDPTLAMHLANSDPFGAEAAVAVSGGFAFGAEINNNNDGRINIYNVSSPGAPLFVRQQAVAGVSGLAYRALVPLGANYLIAITPDRPFGGDYDIWMMNPVTGFKEKLIGDATSAEVDAVAIYPKFVRTVFKSSLDEPNGHTIVNPQSGIFLIPEPGAWGFLGSAMVGLIVSIEIILGGRAVRFRRGEKKTDVADHPILGGRPRRFTR